MKGFREFILRGNVIDLAVAVVIGAAFTAIVTSLVTNIFTPIIGALFNASSLNKALIVDIPKVSGGEPAHIMFGAFIASVINFVIIAAVVYFVFVLPINSMLKRAFQKPAEPVSDTPAPPTELDLLAQIRDLLEGRDKVGDTRILNQD
ncbi:MAG: large conductance mechanosensitive channel protein MscL [Acidobacteria bacterium]|nr:large conductance mechanosensitive channel protein MscL [Acidobacteriota bacterium]